MSTFSTSNAPNAQRRRIRRALLVAAAVVLLLTAAALIQLATAGTARGGVTLAVDQERRLDGVLRTLQEFEVSKRNYLLTGAPALNAEAEARSRRLETALVELTDNVPAADRAGLARFRERIDDYLRQSEAIMARRPGGLDSLYLADISRHQLSPLLSKLGAEATDLRQAQRLEIDAARNRVRRRVTVSAVLQLLGFAGLLLLLYFLYRWLIPLMHRQEAAIDELDEVIDRHESTEVARQLMIERLETRNEELDHFAYIASHDLQEPLRTVSNFITIFEEEYGERLDDEAAIYLGFIQEATGRMQHMIESLLRYSQLGRSGEREAVDLEVVVRDVLSNLHAQVTNTRGNVTVGHLPVIWGYPGELRQLFQNLISNALKFVAEGDEPIVHIDCEEGEQVYVVSVSDQGIGMSQNDRGKIFQMFNRVNKPGEYAGYGIGLAFCRKIVELHGGNLSVASAPNLGSTFSFTLPYYIVRDATTFKPNTTD